MIKETGHVVEELIGIHVVETRIVMIMWMGVDGWVGESLGEVVSMLARGRTLLLVMGKIHG